MSKELTPLEALESIKRTIQQLDYGFISKEDCEDFAIIETALEEVKELRATHFKNNQTIIKLCHILEIIKEKLVDMTRLKVAIYRKDLSYYNYYCYKPLTKEEYDLLKEVLS